MKLVEISKNSLFRNAHMKKLKNVKNKTILLTKCNHSLLSVRFPYAETLFINHCDQHFTFFNLDTYYFPNLKHIYLNCHPFRSEVLLRHHKENKDVSIYMSNYWKDYYHHKWELYKYDFIRGISDEKICNLINMYDKEDLQYE